MQNYGIVFSWSYKYCIITLCSNNNYHVNLSIVTLKDGFPNYSMVVGGYFDCFLFLMQCNAKIGAREVEYAIFHNLARTTLEPAASRQAGQKFGLRKLK